MRPDHPLALGGLANLGEALSAAGRYDEAVVADESALAAVRRVLGPEHPEVALILSNECETLNRAQRFTEAHRACARAMEIWSLVRPDALILFFTRTQLGIALIGLGRPADAIAPLEASLTSRVAAHSAMELQGESRFALARAIWSRAADHPRALGLARQARQDYSANAKAVAEIDAWLAAPHR